MAVKFRDYYETLGVDKNASDAEIKSGFRKLARRYHPDVAKDKDIAEDKFKAINEAYEVLSDPEKRQKYDDLGPDWEQPRGGFGGAGGGGAGHAGFDFEGTGFSDFFESMFGQQSHGGAGGFGGYGGQQQAPRTQRGADIETDILISLEECMTGSQRSLKFNRPNPDSGVPANKTVKIKIPKGISAGQQIRVGKMGNPGINGGEPGDLYLHVRLERHPDFQVEGSDLIHELRLAPWEAVLGTTTAIRHLHGETKIKIPAGTEGSTEFRLGGKGLPKESDEAFGDLYAKVIIVPPTEINDEEKALWEKLRDTSEFDPRG
ncbi:MAG: curved DNA-binding protein [Verrucomicrobiales bacterium]|jgi:curved DNA-binding protein